MDIYNTLSTLGVNDKDAKGWVDDYKLVCGAKPLEKIWWRDKQKRQKVCKRLNFSKRVSEIFDNAARRIDNEAPAIWDFLALASPLFKYDDNELRGRALAREGLNYKKWAELSSLFKALVYFTGIDSMLHSYKKLGIPESIIINTVKDLPIRMEKYEQLHGQPGILDKGWFTNHLRVRLFALGRLQFVFSQFALPFLILKNSSNEIAILVESKRNIRVDGQFASADGGNKAKNKDNWVTSLEEDDKKWSGYAVDENGQIVSKLRHFYKDKWRPIMKRGDNILEVHIPAWGPLDTQMCEESFKMTEDFYPSFFPNFRFTGFSCISWLMDSQLRSVLGAESNITKFINLFAPLPVPGADDKQLFERVFNGAKEISEAPRDTNLQRRIIKGIKSGKQWRKAGGIKLAAHA